MSNPRRTKTPPAQISSATLQSWTDTVFALYVEGSLTPLSAAEVCQWIDWISQQPHRVEQIEQNRRHEPEMLRARLIELVRDWTRQRGEVSALATKVSRDWSRSA